ncbi:MAG: DNA/RNA nuclease SfsA [Clostridia bacterium]|nr:DNA/RNA nuclease SfsA [Clostridia bacterium]
MRYEKVLEAKFIERPNRFVARVMLDGEEVVCHVKNTGRCRELLVPGCTVYLEDCRGRGRKTDFDLIAVLKGDWMINMDSQAPNKAVGEYIRTLFPNATLVRPETRFGNSRFDFYVETPERKIFMEVKGVTLEENREALFPDAPTERGVKHIRELIACLDEGYEAYILFVVQMEGILCLRPNDRMHPAFGDALREAAKEGVRVLAVECRVTPDTMELTKQLPVELGKEEADAEKNC